MYVHMCAKCCLGCFYMLQWVPVFQVLWGAFWISNQIDIRKALTFTAPPLRHMNLDWDAMTILHCNVIDIVIHCQ